MWICHDIDEERNKETTTKTFLVWLKEIANGKTKTKKTETRNRKNNEKSERKRMKRARETKSEKKSQTN